MRRLQHVVFGGVDQFVLLVGKTSPQYEDDFVTFGTQHLDDLIGEGLPATFSVGVGFVSPATHGHAAKTVDNVQELCLCI